jgi:hypothetical protein
MQNLSTTMAVTAANHNQLTTTAVSCFSKLKNLIDRVFSDSNANTYGASLEAYIMMNEPQTPHDVELLEREFARKRRDLDIYTHLR